MGLPMNITLPSDLQKFVDQKIVTGEYPGAMHVIREALWMLKARDDSDLGDEIAIGLSQLDCGKTAKFTAKDIQPLGRKILKARSSSNR